MYILYMLVSCSFDKVDSENRPDSRQIARALQIFAVHFGEYRGLGYNVLSKGLVAILFLVHIPVEVSLVLFSLLIAGFFGCMDKTGGLKGVVWVDLYLWSIGMKMTQR